MTARRLACALLCIALPAALAAQTNSRTPPPAAPRAFEFPDTLGAAFSASDSARGSATAADFDFLVGLWEFQFQQRRPDGTFNAAGTGHWLAEKKRTTNGFLEDHFRFDNAGTTQDNGTWTYRVFNPQRKLWEMQGVGSESGAWAPGLCWTDGSERHLIQRYGNAMMRIRYFDIRENSFLWRADMSTDGGKTWNLDWWTMKARRLAK